MQVRAARPGEGHQIRPILDRAALCVEDSEDIDLWCKMLDANMRMPVVIQVSGEVGALTGAVLSRANGLRCQGFGAEQTQLLNKASFYVPFLATREDAPFGTGKALARGAVELARMAKRRMILVLLSDERLYRYWKRMWPQGLYSEPGEMSFFMRLQYEGKIYPELFTMAVQEDSRVGVMPLLPGIEMRSFGPRQAVVGAVEDFEPSHLSLWGEGQNVSSSSRS